ncbi:uncharacterized protein V1478_001567 [Vespula squamosa]|uniref:Uncharacterized protein n=1 Tax=Vespula squamosa TaxID=30214 RepID=A0ABD2C1U9_VESSQ
MIAEGFAQRVKQFPDASGVLEKLNDDVNRESTVVRRQTALRMSVKDDKGKTMKIESKIGGDIKVEIKMPREAEEGSTIELRCEWRLLGGAGLYSVKWYKDEHEFFRYVPDNDPKIQTFPQLGIHLDVSTFQI